MKIFNPHDYQEIGIKWLLQHSFNGLFWDPGLGKTATTLAAFKILQELDMIDTMLVVSTKHIVSKTWAEEISSEWEDFAHLKYSLIRGNERRRLEAMHEPSDIYGINFENLKWLCSPSVVRKWGKARCWLVIDESSKMRNVNTKRFKSFRHKLPKFARRTILTGTPIPHGYINLYGQMYCVDMGETLGPRVGQFRNMYFHPVGYGGYGWEINEGADVILEKKIATRILRFDDSKLNLPPVVEVDCKVELPEKAMDFYREIEKEFCGEYGGKTFTLKSAATATNKLWQIANGAVFKQPSPMDWIDSPDDEPKREVVQVHDAKIDKLVELVEEFNGRPVLIAFMFTHDRKRITEALIRNTNIPLPKDDDGKRFVPCIAGGTREADALKWMKQWNEGKLPVLLGHPQSVGHGLNLQKVRAHIIWFSMTWNLEDYIQFIKRINRQGQKAARTMVYRIMAKDTVDEVIAENLRVKGATQKRLLDRLKQFTKNRIEDIKRWSMKDA